MAEPEVLEAPNILEYPYARSVGPIIGRFMTALRDRKFLGIRAKDGHVICPPTEYDPETGEELAVSDLVEVGPAGEVTTWAWVNHPRDQHPLDRPFAWALVQLDGADTALLHALDAPSSDAVSTGMRVKARWKAERVGHITDIECFEPEAG
jgi:uncharacterized OB-fold protein